MAFFPRGNLKEVFDNGYWLVSNNILPKLTKFTGKILAMADYYQTLGVSNMATADCIRKAFRAKAKEMHPDTNPGVSPDDFFRINEAYQVLSDENKRRIYDLRLKHGITGQRVYYRPGDVRTTYHAQYRQGKKSPEDEIPGWVEKFINYFLFLSLFLASLYAIFFGIYRLFQEPINGVNPYHGVVLGVVLTVLMLIGYFTYIKANKN